MPPNHFPYKITEVMVPKLLRRALLARSQQLEAGLLRRHQRMGNRMHGKRNPILHAYLAH